jgi:Uma2 family endonuclease
MVGMTQATSHRLFEPGTTGWTIDDLSDPEIQWQWSEGRYEIVEGVLTKMAPQGFDGIDPLSNLRRLLERHLDAVGLAGTFYHEVDVLLRTDRTSRPDMVFLTAEQRRTQKRLQRRKKLPPGKYHPIYKPPMFVVESVSRGHERHDRVTKRQWYADAGIPHYWLLTEFERSLVCLVLQDGRYVEEASGENDDVIASSIFAGVNISLAQVWDDV